jgi:hypothetical protein
MSHFAVRSVIKLGLVILLFTLSLHGQSSGTTEGYNSVSSDTIGTGAASSAFIDVTPFFTTDLCLAINTILTSSNYTTNFPNGAVLDARGILVSSCSAPL